jgi:hypothetical protein
MKDRQPQTTSHEESPKVRVILPGGPGTPRAVSTAFPSPFRLGQLSAGLRQRLGALLLILVVVAVIVYQVWPGNSGSDTLTVVNGYGGALKVSFMEDPEVAAILAEKYGLQVDITAVGSIDLACGMPLKDDDDFVWLGDSVALAIYANRGATYPDRGCTMLRSDDVYNSPIVLYSWAPVVDALVAAGVAETTADGAYTLDFAKLVDLMMAGTTWAEIGLPQLHGRIIVHTTDPNRSNSGLLFAGMLANTLNGGDVVNATTVTPLLPEMQGYFQRLGLMRPTSGDLFEQFLITGIGGKPIVALYESQIPEFLEDNPSYRAQIQQQVRILYPEPTVWASHPFVVRNDNANLLLDALKDPEIQRLAWENHGQRPGVPSVVIDPDAIPVPGILREVISVTSMPALEEMDRILAAIAAPPDSATPASAIAPLAPIGLLMLIRRARLAPPGWLGRPPSRRRRAPTLQGLRAAARRLGLLAVMLGLITPGAAVAQGDVDVDVNVIVGFAAPYAPEPGAILIPSANFETVLVNGDDVVVVTNGEFDQPAQIRLEALEGLDADTDGLVSVDAGTSADPMYWLDIFTVDDAPYGAFTISRPGQTGTTITMFMSNVAGFADGLAVAQQSVIVDGSPIFEGVDPGGLQVLLDVALPELGSGTTPADEGESPTEEATTDDIDAFADQPGMVGDGAYVSPHHGFALTWTEAWILDPAFEEPVTSDVNFDVDQVYLTVDSPQWVWITFTAADTQGFPFADVFSSVTGPSYVAQIYGETAELVVFRVGINANGDEVGAFIVRLTTPEGYDLVAYEEWRLADDGNAVAGLQLLMLVDDVESGLEASDDLEIDGGPVITLFTHDEILSLARDAEVL